mmetsp:Transcript_49257/g.73455  ORF Transcript_49257/g.73455 Transcript_49257/m.73455 type:complete len:170 (-) Transcript_49257:157-666(-)
MSSSKASNSERDDERMPCRVCETPTIRKCKACKVAAYCSRPCQAQDWKRGNHKAFCKQLCQMEKELLDGQSEEQKASYDTLMEFLRPPTGAGLLRTAFIPMNEEEANAMYFEGENSIPKQCERLGMTVDELYDCKDDPAKQLLQQIVGKAIMAGKQVRAARAVQQDLEP